MRESIGLTLMIIAVIVMLIGIFGMYRFNNFYTRILLASKIDTVGYITLLIGAMLYRGWSFYSLKVAFIILLMIIVNPVTSHAIARSAKRSGYPIERK